jgi:hypothetical protein
MKFSHNSAVIAPTSYLTIPWVIRIRDKVDGVVFDRSIPVHPFRFGLYLSHPAFDVVQFLFLGVVA